MSLADWSAQRRLVVLVALALVVTVGVGVFAGTTAASDHTNESTESVIEEIEGMTLTELQRGGASIDSSPPSVRATDEQMYWLIHWPAQLLSSGVGDRDSDGWEYLERGTTVERNSVYLRTINQGAAEDLTATVVIYDEGEREEGNSTIGAPENIEVFQHEVTLDRGWAMAEIDLPQTNEPREVTIWVEGHEDALRWTFTHDSVATTQPIEIETYGDALAWALIWLIGPTFIGSVGVGYGAKRLLERAGEGPGWGYGRWAVIAAVIVGGAAIMLFSDIAQLLVNATWIISAFLVIFIGAIVLETYRTNRFRAMFFQPTGEHTEGPDREDMYDIIHADYAFADLVEIGSNQLAVISPGLLAFLSRAVGGTTATLDSAKKLQTAIEMPPGSDLDLFFFVNPDAPAPIEYEPEGWTIGLPSSDVCPNCQSVNFASVDEFDFGDEDDITGKYACRSCGEQFDEPDGTFRRSDLIKTSLYGVGIVAAAGLMLSLSGSMILAVAAGGVATLAAVAKPTEGYARFDPAKGHTRDSWGSMMYLDKEQDKADTFDELRETALQNDVDLTAAREKAIAERDSVLSKLLLGQFDTETDFQDLLAGMENPDTEVSQDD